jgi:hypothetical protein
MKRIFSFLSAGVIALMAASCVQEPLAVFDPAKTTAPVLGTVEIGAKNVAVSYTPAEFKLGFNSQIAPTHSLAIVGVDGKSVSKLVSSKNDGSTLTATNVNISKALAFFGYTDGQSVSALDIVVRATIQDPSRDNGRNGFVDSDKYTISNFLVTLPQGSPYQDYTEATTWSVIGSLSNYGISWDGDIEMFATEDGNHLVAKAVKLSKDDEFKFRKDQSWDVNMGGEFGSLDSEFSVSQDGPNVKVGADGTYDLWLDLDAGTAMVTDAYMAYPDHKDASEWTVIGSLSNYGISWDGDLPMITDGKTHVAQGIKIAAGDEFKFRKDQSWDVNMGGEFGSLGSEFAVSQDGPNIKVGADGIYDLILDPSGTATIVETLGGGVSGKIGGDEPEPEPVTVTGWNVIGANGDWENDIIASEKGGVWTAYINAPEATNFKWRKDGGWDENYGGVMEELGKPFAAVAGGDNINIEAGFWKAVLDLSNEAAPTITVSAADVFGLIGVNGDWNNDIWMTEADGKWVSPATQIEGDFKIRRNASWDENYGGTFEELGKAFEAVPGGDNIKVEAGEYIVTFDPSAKTITVDAALPSNTWSVIGVNGDWNNDHFMTELAPGIWVSDMLEITSEGWKVRFNHNWDVNRGGATPEAVGQFVEGVPGGDNINLTGTFKVVYNALNGTIGTLGWGITGSIAALGINWDKDVPMNLAADGKWYSVPFAIGDGDQIKVRFGAGWDNNFGGACTAADEAFEAVPGGDNITAPAAGTYMVVYDPAAGTLTLSTGFWGLIGEFNSWGADSFLLPDGSGKWYAYHLDISGGWKIRKGAKWDVNFGGTYAAAGEPIEGVPGGDNIAVTDLTNFSVVFDETAGTITVNK